MDSKDLINWGELSRQLAGSRSVITRSRIGKKHRNRIENLIRLIDRWQKDGDKLMFAVSLIESESKTLVSVIDNLPDGVDKSADEFLNEIFLTGLHEKRKSLES